MKPYSNSPALTTQDQPVNQQQQQRSPPPSPGKESSRPVSPRTSKSPFAKRQSLKGPPLESMGSTPFEIELSNDLPEEYSGGGSTLTTAAAGSGSRRSAGT